MVKMAVEMAGARQASLDAERPAPLALPGPACSARATARCVRPSHDNALSGFETQRMLS